MTPFERFNNSKIIMSLINRSYEKFKEQYPNEEPFWKISCFKKINRTKIVNKSDLDMNWRQIETNNESKTSPVINEIKECRIKKETRVRTITKSQENRTWNSADTQNPRVIKGKPIITNDVITITHTDETYLSDAHPMNIDINMKYDDPSYLTVHVLSEEFKVIEEKIAVWGKEMKGMIISSGDGQLVGLAKKIEMHMDEMNQLKNKIMELEQRNSDYQALIHQFQLEKEELKTKEVNFDRLNKVIKKNWTVGEVITKYAETQEKLNEAKMSVTNTLKKHSRLNITDLYKKYGFIGSFKHVVQYFDSEYDSPDEYDGSDID